MPKKKVKVASKLETVDSSLDTVDSIFTKSGNILKKHWKTMIALMVATIVGIVFYIFVDTMLNPEEEYYPEEEYFEEGYQEIQVPSKGN